MSLPALPPIPDIVLETLDAAPLIAGPAEEVTLDRPSEAFDWIFVALSFAFVVTSCVEAWRRGWRAMRRLHRRTRRGVAAEDMISGNEPLRRPCNGNKTATIGDKQKMSQVRSWQNF